MSEKTIQSDSEVAIHFDIRLKDGSIADSTRNIGRPMTFKLGEQVFSDKLEHALVGLKAGDKKKVMLLPDEAFGEPHPANIFQVPKSKFAGSDLEDQIEEGLIVEFAQISGQPRPGIITKVEEHELTVDFNHPLAGQVVLFDVEVVDVIN